MIVGRPDFTRFYNQYFEKIYRYIFYRVGGNRERAEDLTSEIFMKALEHYESYDPSRSTSSWIFTIARNHLLNAIRDAKPQVSLEAAAETGEDLGVIPIEAMNAVMRHAGVSDLARALEHVSPDARRLLVMKFIEGWSYKDLSREFNRSPAALRVAVYRSMKELKAKYRD